MKVKFENGDDLGARLVMYSPKKRGFFAGIRPIQVGDETRIDTVVRDDPYDEGVLAWSEPRAFQDTLNAVCEVVKGVSFNDFVVMARSEPILEGDRP